MSKLLSDWLEGVVECETHRAVDWKEAGCPVEQSLADSSSDRDSPIGTQLPTTARKVNFQDDGSSLRMQNISSLPQNRHLQIIEVMSSKVLEETDFLVVSDGYSSIKARFTRKALEHFRRKCNLIMGPKMEGGFLYAHDFCMSATCLGPRDSQIQLEIREFTWRHSSGSSTIGHPRNVLEKEPIARHMIRLQTLYNPTPSVAAATVDSHPSIDLVDLTQDFTDHAPITEPTMRTSSASASRRVLRHASTPVADLALSNGVNLAAPEALSRRSDIAQVPVSTTITEEDRNTEASRRLMGLLMKPQTASVASSGRQVVIASNDRARFEPLLNTVEPISNPRVQQSETLNNNASSLEDQNQHIAPAMRQKKSSFVQETTPQRESPTLSSPGSKTKYSPHDFNHFASRSVGQEIPSDQEQLLEHHDMYALPLSEVSLKQPNIPSRVLDNLLAPTRHHEVKSTAVSPLPLRVQSSFAVSLSPSKSSDVGTVIPSWPLSPPEHHMAKNSILPPDSSGSEPKIENQTIIKTPSTPRAPTTAAVSSRPGSSSHSSQHASLTLTPQPSPRRLGVIASSNVTTEAINANSRVSPNSKASYSSDIEIDVAVPNTLAKRPPGTILASSSLRSARIVKDTVEVCETPDSKELPKASKLIEANNNEVQNNDPDGGTQPFTTATSSGTRLVPGTFVSDKDNQSHDITMSEHALSMNAGSPISHGPINSESLKRWYAELSPDDTSESSKRAKLDHTLASSQTPSVHNQVNRKARSSRHKYFQNVAKEPHSSANASEIAPYELSSPPLPAGFSKNSTYSPRQNEVTTSVLEISHRHMKNASRAKDDLISSERGLQASARPSQSIHSGRTPSYSERSNLVVTTSPHTMKADVFGDFCRAYPDYMGDRRHFRNLCQSLDRLRSRNQQPRHWDDFIVRHKTEFAKHVLRCTEDGENPLPYDQFYRERHTSPMYLRGIVGMKQLAAVLDQDTDPRQPSRTGSSHTQLRDSYRPNYERPMPSTVYNGTNQTKIDLGKRDLYSTTSRNQRRSLPWADNQGGKPSEPTATENVNIEITKPEIGFAKILGRDKMLEDQGADLDNHALNIVHTKHQEADLSDDAESIKTPHVKRHSSKSRKWWIHDHTIFKEWGSNLLALKSMNEPLKGTSGQQRKISVLSWS